MISIIKVFFIYEKDKIHDVKLSRRKFKYEIISLKEA